MNVVFRVDASKHIGSGHVMRCKILAEELRRRGAQIRFICRAHDGNLISVLQKLGFIVDILPAKDLRESVSDLTYSNEWLVVEPKCDAKQTIQALDKFVVDWLIVDHYGIDSSWENEIRPFVKSILVIDDLADREHDCDILIDQNWFGCNTDSRYTGLVPEHCHLLLGPRYAILPQVFSQISKSLPPRDGSIKRVLIFMGGVDSGNQTLKALEALCRPELLHFAVDVIIGSSNANIVHIEKLALTRADTSIYKNLPNLAGLMARADLMLGAGGTTTWERCSLGLPAIVITAAENQVGFTKLLTGKGVHKYLGDSLSTDCDDWYKAIFSFLEDTNKINVMSKMSLKITDGLGIKRISTRLQGGVSSLYLRQANLDDENLLLNWANEPVVRAHSFNKEIISTETHHNWLIDKLADKNCIVLIGIDSHELPVGQVRFDCDGEEAFIDVSIDSALRGCGLGALLLNHAIKFWQDLNRGEKLVAEVLSSNKASQSLFSGSGFTKHNQKGRNKSLRYILN